MDLDVLYRDNHIIVLNKAAGVPTQEDESGDPDLLNGVRAYIKEQYNKPGKVFTGLVHRLDRPVSGVMVFARTSKAASRLSDQFRRRLPEKRYLAMVRGNAPQSARRRDFLLKAQRKVHVVPADTPGAKPAELAWTLLAQRNGMSLLEVRPATGRPHQIRVQLAAGGFPIIGDLKYGGPRFDRRSLALHAVSLCIVHPTRKERLQWFAAPPASWGDVFRPEIAKYLLAASANPPGNKQQGTTNATEEDGECIIRERH